MGLRNFTIATGIALLSSCGGKVPEHIATSEVHLLEQNWNPELRSQFYHTAQGTEIMPYEWFLALEQPSLKLFGAIPLFAESSYLARFGFLPSPVSALNPDGLPVGFVKDTEFVDPRTNERRDVVGFTCAACHTGQVEYVDQQGDRIGLRIDGGAALANPILFEQALGEALAFTDKVPFRFDRFARRVLGANYSEENRAGLKRRFKQFLDYGLKEFKVKEKLDVYPHPFGYGRVDALNDIGNQVFGLRLDGHNWRASAAPVNFPHLWETSWFDYVQYNGSIPNPLIRNIGEALGVKAPVVLTGPETDWFKTSVHVDHLIEIEQWLAGEAPYQGLTAPLWPEQYLGSLDQVQVQQGKALYAELCVSCHLPSQQELEADLAADSPQFWTARNDADQPLLKLTMVELEVIGTDSKQAQDFVERTVDTANLGMGEMNAGAALEYVVEQVARRYFRENSLSEAEQLAAGNGHRIGSQSARIIAAYRARPLSGVWATPPYLHNGSVPTLYHLLSPVDERPRKFGLGSRLFDTHRVGYQHALEEAPSVLDTTLVGNGNQGHEFNDGTGPGIIGRKLSETERFALVEYLKTL